MKIINQFEFNQKHCCHNLLHFSRQTRKAFTLDCILILSFLSQHKLEGALLALGQFQHALSELQSWLSHTHATLDTQRPISSDPKAIEIELAKHHVHHIGPHFYAFSLFKANSFNQAVFVGFKKRCAVPSVHCGDSEQSGL